MTNAPSLARALISCHQAYRKATEQLVSLDDALGRNASVAEPSPYEEVRDFFHFVDNYVHELDIAAEKLAHALSLPEREAGTALTDYLERKHGVRTTRGAAPTASRALVTLRRLQIPLSMTAMVGADMKKPA